MIRDRLVFGIPQRKLSIFDITGSDEFIRQVHENFIEVSNKGTLGDCH